jgi:hypothetical protein
VFVGLGVGALVGAGLKTVGGAGVGARVFACQSHCFVGLSTCFFADHAHVSANICMYVCMYIYIYTYMILNMCVCIYIYIICRNSCLKPEASKGPLLTCAYKGALGR